MQKNYTGGMPVFLVMYILKIIDLPLRHKEHKFLLLQLFVFVVFCVFVGKFQIEALLFFERC